MPKRTRPPGLSDGSENIATGKLPGTTGNVFGLSKVKSGSQAKASESVAKKLNARTVKVSNIKARNKIIVAVDYGTTYSGVAFVMSNSDARDVQVITDWAAGARFNEQLEKVPSKVAYAAENEGLEEDKFGYEVEGHMKAYSWTKILLDRNAAPAEFDNNTMRAQLGMGLMQLPADMTEVEVAADYLCWMHEHIMEKLAKICTKEMLSVTPIDFWFTYPANWSDEACAATRQAAIHAGFEGRPKDTLSMITEPEAAAMAILTNCIEKNKGLLKVGSVILIADLGGGTLDFQALRIVSLEPLKTEEACRGDGAKAGSVYIDFSLHDWMESTFGDAYKRLPMAKTAAGSAFMQDWEVTKKMFKGKDLKKEHRLRLPSLGKELTKAGNSPTSYDFSEHEVVITGHDVLQAFATTVEKGLALVMAQNQLLHEEGKKLKMIALCGGLGMSEYIWKVFEECCVNKLHNKVTLITDERAWSAVVRGAAIRGLEGSIVISKRAKKAYGIGVHQVFREGVDKEEESFDCPIKGKRAPGYIDWVVTKGKQFTPNFRAASKVYEVLEDDADDLVSVWDLYSCAKDDAPNRVGHPDVRHEGKIRLDFGKVYGKTYKRVKMGRSNITTGNGSEDAVGVNIVIKLGSDRGVLEVEALHNRTVVGTAKIDYGKSHARKPVQCAGLL